MNSDLLTAITQYSYIIASILFIIGLKKMNSPATARFGNTLSAVGMLIAVVVTLLDQHIMDFKYIGLGLIIGTVAGGWIAQTVAMTKMPEMVALLNGFGGLASVLVSIAMYNLDPNLDSFTAVSTALAVFIGGVTFTGSVLAWAKLSEVVSGKPMQFRGQQIFNGLLLLGSVGLSVIYSFDVGVAADLTLVLWILTAFSFIFGITSVMPIGGADMPVVISLLNSYSGMAACAAGFVLTNNVLIVTGSLVGASGIILTSIMCKAMNRSLGNVLFSGFGAVSSGASAAVQGEVKEIKADDAYVLLEAAHSIVVVPGYGLAVAQAQHAAKELADALEKNGAEVRFAIHPVAGRMPGHMNVLLAEANLSYDHLAEMDSVNPSMDIVDVCLIVGANDVVNTAAREDKASPLYGMPIINADKAKNVIVLKRSMKPGFSGVENNLFYKSNVRMLFGDAKQSILGLVAQFKEGA